MKSAITPLAIHMMRIFFLSSSSVIDPSFRATPHCGSLIPSSRIQPQASGHAPTYASVSRRMGSLGGQFGGFLPGLRHLQEYVALCVGSGTPSPTEALQRVLAILLNIHDVASFVPTTPLHTGCRAADCRFKEKLRYFFEAI
jgi:hypothetical protein